MDIFCTVPFEWDTSQPYSKKLKAEAWVRNTTLLKLLKQHQIYKQGHGSSLNIKRFFFFLEPKWQKRTDKGIRLPRVGPAVAGAFFIQKISYEIFQVYRNIETHACVNRWLDLQFSLCFRLGFNISKYQSRHYFDWRDGKNTIDEEQRKREQEWIGANVFLNLEFSVWCKLISHSHYKKAFSGSHCLRAASRHSSGSLTSSTLVVRLVTILKQHGGKKEKTFQKLLQQTAKIKSRMHLSYPLITAVCVIPRCAELSLSITRVWSVGKRSTITIIATWK